MRQAAVPIEPLILHRHSPRAMSGQPVAALDLQRLFEAARWAPSSSNLQPWRFTYAVAGEPEFAQFFELLVPFNRDWCQRAGALIAVLSRTQSPEGRPLPTHAFDTGAAWMALALQGAAMGLVVHAMGGFDAQKARAVLAIPEVLALQCMVAVGHPGQVADLPEKLQAREVPSDRRPAAEWTAAGAVPAGWADR